MFGLILKNVCKSKLFVAVMDAFIFFNICKTFHSFLLPHIPGQFNQIKNTKNRLHNPEAVVMYCLWLISHLFIFDGIHRITPNSL
jgi:ABC-type transport system involved in multi-copper enzyme maturation permease subunit